MGLDKEFGIQEFWDAACCGCCGDIPAGLRREPSPPSAYLQMQKQGAVQSAGGEAAAKRPKSEFNDNLPPSFPQNYGRPPPPSRNVMYSHPNDGGFKIADDGRTPGVLVEDEDDEAAGE
eukprot:CAMPEP_0173380974 /NCGR_PEP_ID=MMETSP1356-20130122/3508_1 /TAXON_ID=77927 ORGANISM="Hemiselmis virescens, Strain PCC157" /NCGR_SAMPLE_ID=MMETSP1356 /ASSEMBLY_ACC=CAM_ASM_000847 /LENGTH=118 /DNA_ID=CAMNT_0014334701 /DNA_START=169 /DNA_END=522 /DNA_ORIENTATION=-